MIDELYVPLVTYTAPRADHANFRKLMRWSDAEILIDTTRDTDTIAKSCVAIANGFVAIRECFAEKVEPHADFVARVLRLLGASPKTHAVVEQYAIAAFRRLVQVEKLDESLRNRLACCAVGYWICNQLLMFPGLLVPAVAAASYLDIDVGEFADVNVRAVFDGALYGGPFSQLGPFWWVSELDAIRGGQMRPKDRELISGAVAAERALDRAPLRPSMCIKGHAHAGYYCLIHEAAVCEEHSTHPGTWLPVGADLSRVETERFKQLSPWAV